jgi:acyl carrier protein
MLEPDLDLEADLGIDTVKQAETFSAIREAFDIPVQDGIKLRDYPTLGSVIGFVYANRPDLKTQAVKAQPAPVQPANTAGLRDSRSPGKRNERRSARFRTAPAAYAFDA